MPSPSDGVALAASACCESRNGDSLTRRPMMDTAKFEREGKAQLQDAGDRAQDYLDRASQTASTGMDRVADTARRGVDKATDTAKAGLDWAADQADTLRDTQCGIRQRDDRYRGGAPAHGDRRCRGGWVPARPPDAQRRLTHCAPVIGDLHQRSPISLQRPSRGGRVRPALHCFQFLSLAASR